jgi:3-(3-hydroxy-phenyl)propionate hydroxylase
MKTQVVVAGGGPTGLMLAGELRLAGVDVIVLERDAQRSGESRAYGIQARTAEVFDQRGILDRFAGKVHGNGDFVHFSGLFMQIGDYPTRHPYVMGIPQSEIEPVLEEWALGLGATIVRSREVVGLKSDDEGVDVQVGDEWIRAEYVVGCDGGRSAIRKLAGIGFPGTPPTLAAVQGIVKLDNPPAGRIWGPEGRTDTGNFIVAPFTDGQHMLMVTEYDKVVERDVPATFEDLREVCIRVAGHDFGMHSPAWISRYADAARQAETYRAGRVLLAGDAAHVHYPAGGQGLNLGIQDAVNVAWKLAAVVRGQAPEGLLDTYHAERFPYAERVLEATRAQTVLGRPGPHSEALRDVFSKLTQFEEVNRYFVGMFTQLDVQYPMAGDHPLLGRRIPDLDLKTSSGDVRLFSLLTTARPVLFDFVGLANALDGWRDRVDQVSATTGETWDIASVGTIPAPPAVLVRPDGYVAWVGSDVDGLRAALTTWFGPAS